MCKLSLWENKYIVFFYYNYYERCNILFLKEYKIYHLILIISIIVDS